MICYLSFFADRQGEYRIAFIDYEGCCPSFFCYGAVDQFVNAADGDNRIRIRPILPIIYRMDIWLACYPSGTYMANGVIFNQSIRGVLFFRCVL